MYGSFGAADDAAFEIGAALDCYPETTVAALDAGLLGYAGVGAVDLAVVQTEVAAGSSTDGGDMLRP